MPRLERTDEMHYFNILTEPNKSQRGTHIYMHHLNHVSYPSYCTHHLSGEIHWKPITAAITVLDVHKNCCVWFGAV